MDPGVLWAITETAAAAIVCNYTTNDFFQAFFNTWHMVRNIREA